MRPSPNATAARPSPSRSCSSGSAIASEHPPPLSAARHGTGARDGDLVPGQPAEPLARFGQNLKRAAAVKIGRADAAVTTVADGPAAVNFGACRGRAAGAPGRSPSITAPFPSDRGRIVAALRGGTTRTRAEEAGFRGRSPEAADRSRCRQRTRGHRSRTLFAARHSNRTRFVRYPLARARPSGNPSRQSV